jgi:hypothetical protein
MHCGYSEGFEDIPMVRAESEARLLHRICGVGNEAVAIMRNGPVHGNTRRAAEVQILTGHEFDFHPGHDEADEFVSAQVLQIPLRYLLRDPN